jgi:cell division protein WhiA
MSFTSIVKNEISKGELFQTEKYAELSAIIANSGVINSSISLTTENPSVARRVFTIIKDLYSISSKITVRNGYNFSKTYLYIIETSINKENIIKDLSLNNKHKIPSDYLIDEDDTKRAYLRGLFMSCGSVNDPKTSRYHLEFLVSDGKYSIFISNLLNEFDLNSKVLKRENKYMIYVKEAEKISDFLRIIKANEAVLYFEDIRIYRDHKNMTNRLNNCEQANVDKIIQTATEQINDIELIEEIGGYDLLDEKIKEVCTYRKKYPDASLLELSEIISIETGNVITKSGLYHRFKKISILANKIKEKEER